ncbi:MAG: hypothetical protein LDL44_06000 [Caenispirillum sp.]|nr:hypothetical protein [Caenispirillum sp.]
MSLIKLWSSNPDIIEGYTIDRIVANAGDGKLRHESACSMELRQYLAQMTADRLEQYARQCLAEPFAGNGFVLQDIVNELGRRLDYRVTNGRYRGAKNENGYDGLWQGGDGHELVVEVKTTDAYRISLDVIARYRRGLISDGAIGERSSILIVVGRQDTGDLEAQVRGSRHAWDVRLLGVDALIKLVKIKERVDEEDTLRKIRGLLTPLEYTKVDSLIDVVFFTAQDVERGADSAEPPDDAIAGGRGTGGVDEYTHGFTDSETLAAKRKAVLDAFSSRVSQRLIRKSRALYWSPDHTVRVGCTLSKRYVGRSYLPYWYAFHPHWREFLAGGAQGFLLLGGIDLDVAFALPVQAVEDLLPRLNTTEKPDGGIYWHIKISQDGSGYAVQVPKGEAFSLTPFQFSL